MRRRLPRGCGGFTIIELMITVVISGILISGALVSYRGLGTKQLVKQAGISFQTNLKSYQQKALAGAKPAECGPGDTLEGYRVSYLDSNSFSLAAVCTIAVPLATEINLPDGVEFQAAFDPIDIFFPVLASVISGAQTIVLTKDIYSYQVIIEPSGVIRGEFI